MTANQKSAEWMKDQERKEKERVEQQKQTVSLCPAESKGLKITQVYGTLQTVTAV